MATGTLARIHSWRERAMRAASTARNLREKAAHPVKVGLDAVETVGSTFGFSLWKGRVGDPEFLGMPVDLLAGVSLHVAGFLLEGEAEDHLHAIGNGGICAYVAQAGYGMGVEMSAKANHVSIETIQQRRAAGQLDDGRPDPSRQAST